MPETAEKTKKETPPAVPTRSPGGKNGGEASPDTPEPSEALSEPSSDERTIHQRMIAVLSELPAIGKDTKNPEQNFMYRSHDDVLNALNPLFAKHGIYVIPDVLERIAEHRQTARGSTMYEVNLHVRYSFIGPAGDWIAASAWGEGTDMGDKATNKAMTMAFKNVLAQAFAVSTADTVDTDGQSPEETSAGSGRGEKQDAAGETAQAPSRAERMRVRIGEVAGELDTKTGSEPGTFATLLRDGVIAGWGLEGLSAEDDPLEMLDEPSLEEVGRTLLVKLRAESTELLELVPSGQLDFTVPF